MSAFAAPEALPGAEHLDFACNGCGDCCRHHRVALTHLDLERLARELAKPPEALLDWLPPEAVDPDASDAGFVHLREGPRLMVLAHRDGACHLLGADNRCRAYLARPRDCQLYPFVLEHDERRQPVRLALFDPRGCGDRATAPVDFAELARADAERAAELAEYLAQVARWNRLARHRRRFGHRAEGAREFIAFLAAAPARVVKLPIGEPHRG